ncbi:MAG: bifunctional phosphoribosyl-AMP cyclohydrolase/phosphoribosyl-ATP diphosphatase HisIE [Calditrichaeota bacterium]|nr:MAG: bifunctional phosphoribosyl-AMP cyclohydrolase/phosphoribosyl-ATP diphosphatase HisIE [Calditrichota bacterium]
MKSQSDYPIDLKTLKYNKDGLVPAILQHALTMQVLMLGYMNKESLLRSFESGHCWFFSRSKGRLWEKGESSGHYQKIQQIQYDCDADTLLIQVLPDGPTCHTGSISCFTNNEIDSDDKKSASTLYIALEHLQKVVMQRNKERPEGSYSTSLFEAGIGKIAKKFGEEGVEVALAAVGESDERLIDETADLLYNLAILFECRKIELDAVGEALLERAR